MASVQGSVINSFYITDVDSPSNSHFCFKNGVFSMSPWCCINSPFLAFIIFVSFPHPPNLSINNIQQDIVDLEMLVERGRMEHSEEA
jgi:hypothetical protein